MADATTAAMTAAATDTTTATAAATTTAAAATTATTAASTTAAATTDTATAAATTATTTDDWRADLPDDLKEHATRFTSKADLVKGHLALRQQLSKAIIPPGKDAKPEDVASYRKALGVPDAPEAYKFAEPPAGQTLTDEIKASQAEWAKDLHPLNISQAQLDGLSALLAQREAARQAAVLATDKRNSDAAQAELRKDMGADYDRNLVFAERAGKAVADANNLPFAELRQLELKDGRFLLDTPLMIRFLAGVGREMGEGTLGPVVTDDQKAQIDTQIRTVRDQIEQAKAKRDMKEANRLYQVEMGLIARSQGSRPIVGSAGRAA